MPPSFYMWSYSMESWVALRHGDVAFARELGYFVDYFPTMPSKWAYNRIIWKAFHAHADMSRNKGISDVCNRVFKEEG